MNIGKEVKEIEFEPVEAPGTPEPVMPGTPGPAEPARDPVSQPLEPVGV